MNTFIFFSLNHWGGVYQWHNHYRAGLQHRNKWTRTPATFLCQITQWKTYNSPIPPAMGKIVRIPFSTRIALALHNPWGLTCHWSKEICDVVRYRERERGVNSPTLLCWINRLTVKRTYERKSILRTLWSVAGWTKNVIQVTRVSWPDSIVGEEKSQMIGNRPFSAKMTFFI